MLGNCEKKKMTPTNQWTPPQDQIIVDDHQQNFMASTSKPKLQLMEKNTLQEHQRLQLPLNCPRCDSSNTKFCYYNNYSLSQPRHFCKSCKRYWTRGGTLRNVPVGGGCRKNKRVRRPPPPPPSNTGDGISAAISTATTSPCVQQQQKTDLSNSSTANRISNNSMFYNLPTNYPGLNFPFSRFSSPRVTSDSNGYDFNLPQINGLGLGFVQNNEYRDGLDPIKKMEEVMCSTSNSSLAIDPIFFGSSTFAASSTSTMASLLASSLQHQKYMTSGLKGVTPEASNFPCLMPFDGMQMQDENDNIKEKEYKIQQGQNRLDWNLYHHHPVDQQIDSTDSASSLLWSTSNTAGSWFDPSNVGSSVPSLI